MTVDDARTWYEAGHADGIREGECRGAELLLDAADDERRRILMCWLMTLIFPGESFGSTGAKEN